MKQKDLALILVIAFISGVISFVVSTKIFVSSKARQQKIEVVDPIDSSFQTPDKRYFNSSNIDPTPNTQIGNDSNQNPFNGGQ